MSKFIGVKFIDAYPTTCGEFYSKRGWAIPDSIANKDPENPGYAVYYPDGYSSWCPQEEFEKRSFLYSGSDNKVSEEDVNAMIRKIHVEEIPPNVAGTKVTTVTVTLANGFTITESSTCVDPKNYDVEVGIDCCMERIKDKVWFLMGFLLSCGVNGFQKGGAV